MKVYSWRIILGKEGVLNWLLEPFGLTGPGYSITGTWLVFTYLWLPYMILPLYAGLERIPASLLEASSDLGARSGRTFFRVILPLVFPALVAGSIFTFSLTLGDYITPEVVSSTQFIGNVIYDNVGVANNLPLAAAYAFVPISVMVVYLLSRDAQARSRTSSGRRPRHPLDAAARHGARRSSSSTSRSW